MKLAFSALLLLATVSVSPALNFYSTGATDYNTTAPTEEYAGSGWQYQGDWYSVLGTPVAPNYFLSAAHVGGSVGAIFVYDSQVYTTTAVFDDPNSDLRLWQVAGTFSTYAPIYTGNAELGQELVIFGRGSQRGAVVGLSGEDKGWSWGTGDDTRRWGTNVVSNIYSTENYGISLLGMDFNADSGNPNEANYSTGDSGGAVFINDNGTWKIAGINSWADGPYGLTSTPFENAFYGSLYETDGFYGDTLNGWEEVSGPGISYATRVSTSQAWISEITGVPEPTTLPLVVLGSLALLSRRAARRRTAIIEIN